MNHSNNEGETVTGKISTLLVAVGVGTAGGIARYLDDVQHHGKKFARTAFLSAVFVAGFFGWLVSEIATAAGKSDWLYAAAGIGGFMGTQTLDYGLSLLRRKLKIEEERPQVVVATTQGEQK